MIDAIRAVSGSASFNRWAGFEVIAAADGESELRLPWRPGDMGQYAGYLHAGMIAALLDTACGFAAATVSGRVLASHFSMSCIAPAVGDEFVARGHVVKAGRKQVFTAGELYGRAADGGLRLAATASTILVPTGEPLLAT